jgi:hypothetical protein
MNRCTIVGRAAMAAAAARFYFNALVFISTALAL